MKLHTVIVSHDRLELTKQAVASYLDTVTVPYTYMVVDNASSDGTQPWLVREEHPNLLLRDNHYPGYACNRGWEYAPADADFLQRADNDFVFLPGWCDEVERCFQDSGLGQLGLRPEEEEPTGKWNVGGNNIIRRQLWDDGLRYDERPWKKYPPGFSEDSYFTPAVVELGWRWGRVERPCIQPRDQPRRDDPYYVASFRDRRIGHALKNL